MCSLGQHHNLKDNQLRIEDRTFVKKQSGGGGIIDRATYQLKTGASDQKYR